MRTLAQRRERLQSARFYAIVDTGYVTPERVLAVTWKLVEGGVDLIQLRAKRQTAEEIVSLGKIMRAAIPLTPTAPLFILNDHPALAGLIDADGVHVGQDDFFVAEARAQAGVNALVGKSTHSVEQAIAAETEGPDYIGVGPIFATPTKPDYIPVGLGLIGQVQARVTVPQFCIGGVNEATLPQVLAAGGRRIVVVSALLQSPDIPAFCARVREQLNAVA